MSGSCISRAALRLTLLLRPREMPLRLRLPRNPPAHLHSIRILCGIYVLTQSPGSKWVSERCMPCSTHTTVMAKSCHCHHALLRPDHRNRHHDARRRPSIVQVNLSCHCQDSTRNIPTHLLASAASNMTLSGIFTPQSSQYTSTTGHYQAVERICVDPAIASDSWDHSLRSLSYVVR